MASVLTFLTLSSLLLFTSSVDAREGPAEYWKDVMKDLPMPEAIRSLLHLKPVSLSPLENQKHEDQYYNSDSYLQTTGHIYHHGLDKHKADTIPKKDSELRGLLHLKHASLSPLENQKQEEYYNSDSYLQTAGHLYHGLDEHKEDTIPKKDSEVRGLLHSKPASLSPLENQKQEEYYNSDSYLQTAGHLYHRLDEHKEDTIPNKDFELRGLLHSKHASLSPLKNQKQEEYYNSDSYRQTTGHIYHGVDKHKEGMIPKDFELRGLLHSKHASLSPLENQKQEEYYNSDSYLQTTGHIYHGLDEHKEDMIPKKDSELRGFLHSKHASLSPLENQKQKEYYNSDSYLQTTGHIYHGLDAHKEDMIPKKDSELSGLLHSKHASLSPLKTQKQEEYYNSDSYLQTVGHIYHGLDEHKEDTIPKNDSEVRGLLHSKHASLSPPENQKQEEYYNSDSYLQTVDHIYHGLDEHKEETIPKKDSELNRYDLHLDIRQEDEQSSGKAFKPMPNMSTHNEGVESE